PISSPVFSHTARAAASPATRPGARPNASTVAPHSNMQIRLTGAARPRNTRSVSQPVASIPASPATSNAATIQPALDSSIPLASFKIVGPQSSTAYGIVYTKKFAADTIQMYLSENTCRHRSAPYFAGASATCVPSTSGSPTDSGVSRSRANSSPAITSAIAAATQKQS